MCIFPPTSKPPRRAMAFAPNAPTPWIHECSPIPTQSHCVSEGYYLLLAAAQRGGLMLKQDRAIAHRSTQTAHVNKNKASVNVNRWQHQHLYGRVTQEVVKSGTIAYLPLTRWQDTSVPRRPSLIVSGLQTCDGVLVQTVIAYPTVIPAAQSASSNRAAAVAGRYGPASRQVRTRR